MLKLMSLFANLLMMILSPFFGLRGGDSDGAIFLVAILEQGICDFNRFEADRGHKVLERRRATSFLPAAAEVKS